MPEVMNKKVVAIEYPRRNEMITSNTYTFRVAAMPGVMKVEVCIDEGGWQPCRRSEDSFWYDWSGYCQGEHEVVARMQMADGHFHTTEHRFFTVEFANGERNQNGGERRTLSPQRARQLLKQHPELDKHMADKCVVVVPNEPGVVRQLTSLLAEEGVNIDCVLMETVGDVASFRFLVERGTGLCETLEKEGFHVVMDKVFCMDIPNRPGELDRLTRKLAERNVCVRYLYGTSHGKMSKVVFAVDRPDEAVSVVKEMDRRLASVQD